MMLTVTTPMEAYRADLAAEPTRTHFTFADDELLRLGSILHRLTHFTREERARQSRLAEAAFSSAASIVSDPRAGESVSQLSVSPPGRMSALRGAAVLAEEAGALRLAFSMLHLGQLAFATEVSVLEMGQILVQRARVARKAGAPAQASALYAEALSLGTEHELPELVARARLGFSLLAAARGNFPEAAEQIALARQAADAAGVREVTSSIQHQQMIIAAVRRDFDEAIVHAWSAFQDVAGDAIREAEALTNVGQVLYDSGRPSVALRVCLAALTRKPPKRLALPALGGAARAAASVGRHALVRQLIHEIDVLAAGSDLQHDAISARGEAAFALASIAPEEAEARRSAACADAERLGFNALAFRFSDIPKSAATVQPVATATPAATFAIEQATALTYSAEYAGV